MDSPGYMVKMFAGSVAIQHDSNSADLRRMDTICQLPGWFVYMNNEEDEHSKQSENENLKVKEMGTVQERE